MAPSRRPLRSLAIAVLVVLSAAALPEQVKAEYEYQAVYYSYYANLYSYYSVTYEDYYANDSSHYLSYYYTANAYKNASKAYSEDNPYYFYYAFANGFEGAVWSFRAYVYSAQQGGPTSYALYAWESGISAYSHSFIAQR